MIEQKTGPSNESCEQCRFSDLDRVGWRRCRRRSPIVTGVATSHTATWPHVGENDWCGEYQPDRRSLELRRAADSAHEWASQL